MMRRIIFYLLLILLLPACGGDNGANVPATSTPTDSPPTSAATDTATAAPADLPTLPPAPQPTDTLPPPSPTNTLEPTTVPVQAAGPRVALVRFRDSETARSGQLALLVSDIAPPPDGTHLELWLVANDGSLRNIGQFDPTASEPFTVDVGEHLLGLYQGAIISIEPDGAADGELGTVLYEGRVPAGSLEHIRHVLYAFAANPDGKGFLIGADEQLALAIEHADLLQTEIDNGNIGEARRHAEHVVNILDGVNGEFFGDRDSNGAAENPGDGAGVRGYLIGGADHAGFAASTPDVTAEVQLHAGHVAISVDNAIFWLDQAIAEAINVLAADSTAEAQPASTALQAQLLLTRDGEDANGDGNIAPVVGEGGLATAYEHAQNMGSIEFFSEDAAGVEATPTLIVGSTPAPSVVVGMENFAYDTTEVTVPAGSTVRWMNNDDAQHSATASDGTFDTGLFGNGEGADITFNEPGTYAIYCILHGTPEGEGMAMTVTVTEDGAGGGGGDTGGEAVTISMIDFAYATTEVTIPAGTTVTWTNDGEKQHSATASDGSFDTGLFDAGASASITFNDPGTYAYYCTLHGTPDGEGMAGTIIVEP